jgi:hydrogenase/urease accessory protein HupE
MTPPPVEDRMIIRRTALSLAATTLATPALAHIGTGAHTHADSAAAGMAETIIAGVCLIAAVAAVGYGVSMAVERLKQSRVRVLARRDRTPRR